ncbi:MULTISPECIES: hypothetical protein [unclassified Nocardia]|uniref:hypothetical protein n=1 Tax=unclassified Nocardia TaxID=2637762 RepID=UPI001CE3D80D|nr:MULTISPECIES: hypothetical protein [unclassified Nocardia]
MIVIGLLLLIAAVVVGVAAVSANIGAAHALPNDFTVFQHHFSGSTGMLFLSGVVVGAIGMFGLSLMLGGSWRSARGHAATRRELRETRRRMTPARPANAAPSK